MPNKRFYASGPDGMRLSSSVHILAAVQGSTCSAASIWVSSTLVILWGFSRPGWTKNIAHLHKASNVNCNAKLIAFVLWGETKITNMKKKSSVYCFRNFIWDNIICTHYYHQALLNYMINIMVMMVNMNIIKQPQIGNFTTHIGGHFLWQLFQQLVFL